MPSFEFDIGDKEAAISRFLSAVHTEIQRAFSIEKSRRKLTQQSIADTLGVNRSVINRQVMGYENLTAKSIAELAWAIGYEPKLSLSRTEDDRGANFSQHIDLRGGSAPPMSNSTTTGLGVSASFWVE